MYNDLFKIGSFTIHGYGLMIGMGILCAVLTAGIRAKKKGLDREVVYSLGLLVLVFGFIGAKLLYCLIEIDTLFKNPLEVLSGSGFVVYGGIIGGMAAAMIYCKVRKISFLRYFDLLIPSVALAQGFGRIGCFLAGCCYGRETDSFIGIIFQNSAIAPNGIKLIPTQLISSAGDFLIAMVLLLYARKERKVGRAGAIYLILYGVGRFIIEFFRDDYRGSIGFLSTSQFISLIMLLLGIGMLFMHKLPWLAKRKALNT